MKKISKTSKSSKSSRTLKSLQTLFNTHRVIGLLAVIVFLFSAVSAGSESGIFGEDDFSVDFLYLSSVSKELIEDTFVFSDEWFLNDPAERNDRLGLASAWMAALSKEGEAPAEVFKNLGFLNVKAVRYDSTQTDDCAYVIGTKEIIRDGKTATLVAVVFQGRNYGAKGWLQNVTVNPDNEISIDHGSYAKAARYFLSDIEEILAGGNLVFWISGLSRAGGIANITAARLLEREDPPVVYCYTLEAPATTQNKDAKDPKYRSIHNYTCTDDPVPKVPLWDMVRYGNDYCYDSLPYEDVILTLNNQNSLSLDYTGLIDPSSFHDTVKLTLDTFINNLGRLIPTREDYSKVKTVTFPNGDTFQYSWQDSFGTICKFIFKENRSNLKKSFSPGLANNLLDMLSEEILARRKALRSCVDEAPVFRMKERLLLAEDLSNAIEATMGMSYPKEDMYALIRLLDLLIAPEIVLLEEDYSLTGDPADPASIVFDNSDLDAFALYGSKILFSHQVDVIIARLKLLALAME